MKKFRKIVIDNFEYRCLYHVDDYDYLSCPYLLVVPVSNPKSDIKIYFSIKEHYLLNSGFPAKFNGEDVSINLNKPSFVAEIICQCKKIIADFDGQKRCNIDGIDILNQLGYELAGE